MPLSFPHTPKWLQTPAQVLPIVDAASIGNGNAGPYEHGGKLFWVYSEDAVLGGVQLVAYRSDDNGQSQPMVRIPPTSPIPNDGACSVSSSGTLISVAFLTRAGATHFVKTVTFDMSANGGLGGFNAVNDTGISYALSATTGPPFPVQRANGDLVVFYEVSGTVSAVIYNGVVWSAPITIGTGTHRWPLISANAISSGNIGIWWSDGTNIKYCVLAGSTPTNTTVTSQTDIVTNNPIATQQLPYATIYDSVSDTSAWVFLKNLHPDMGVYIASVSPSNTPVATVTLIYQDVADSLDFLNPTLAGNAPGNIFVTLLWSAILDTQLQILQGTSLTAGPWAGPTLYYDDVPNPPSPPPGNNHTVFPSFSRFLSTGVLANTSGLTVPAGSDGISTPVAMIAAALVPVVVTCPIGSATVNISYTGTVVATSGTPPYTFAIISGALPPGLTLDPATGIITGIPLLSGTFAFTVQVTDSLGATATATCSILIPPVPTTGGRGFIKVHVNHFDSCLGREYLLYQLINRELLKCGVKPFCFATDERDWGGNFSEHEEVPMGPPEGAIAFNPTGAITLPSTASGDNVILQFRIPWGYDGVILGQYHGYYSSPTSPVPAIFVQGSGDITWRLAIASRFSRDCGNMLVSLGSVQNMSPIAGGLQVRSENLIQYIVAVPNVTGALVPGFGNVVAGIHGWFWPRH